jgi:hypothetical protein
VFEGRRWGIWHPKRPVPLAEIHAQADRALLAIARQSPHFGSSTARRSYSDEPTVYFSWRVTSIV